MNSLLEIYKVRVAERRIQSDPAQIAAIDELEELEARILASKKDHSLIKGWLRRNGAKAVKGLYIWGSVGSGKSMLMDLLFDTTTVEGKSRIHFLEFVQEVHARLHEVRKSGVNDAIPPVAKEISRKGRLLCLDEMEITDIADAMIVGRLFECLFNCDIAVCTTSNRAPAQHYEKGLNRKLFLPFVDLLNEKMVVHQLDGGTDYRQNRIKGEKTYFCPADDAATSEMDRIWMDLIGGEPETLILKVSGREIRVPQFRNGAARARFWELCAQPLGPGDFLALAKFVRVLLLDDIPLLSRSNYNEARRFIMLIDALYDSGVKLIASADAEPSKLYVEGEGSFAFQRTASRLIEMQSSEWSATESQSRG